jgi:hypothetical protein
MGRPKKPTPKRPWQPLRRGTVHNVQRYLDHGLSVPDAVWLNDRYSVFVREIGEGALHLSFHRHDRQAVRDWRHFQAIKNEVAGPERTAVEVFPPESRLVDTSNEYHLWVLPPGLEMPFGLDDGEALVMTQEEIVAEYGRTKARQRDWEKGIPTGRGIDA